MIMVPGMGYFQCIMLHSKVVSEDNFVALFDSKLFPVAHSEPTS